VELTLTTSVYTGFLHCCEECKRYIDDLRERNIFAPWRCNGSDYQAANQRTLIQSLPDGYIFVANTDIMYDHREFRSMETISFQQLYILDDLNI